MVFCIFVCYSAAFGQLCFHNKDWIGLDWTAVECTAKNTEQQLSTTLRRRHSVSDVYCNYFHYTVRKKTYENIKIRVIIWEALTSTRLWIIGAGTVGYGGACPPTFTNGWARLIEHGLTSAQTQYRLYGRRTGLGGGTVNNGSIAYGLSYLLNKFGL